MNQVSTTEFREFRNLVPMDAFEQRVQTSFGALRPRPRQEEEPDTDAVRNGNFSPHPIPDSSPSLWSLGRSPCFRQDGVERMEGVEHVDDDDRDGDEAAERRRRRVKASGASSCSSSSDDDDDASMMGRAVDFDEAVGERASLAFCSQLDREAEQDEVDIASLQFDGEPSWGAVGGVPARGVLKTRESRRYGGLKSGNEKRVSFDLPPLPTPYVPPHKRVGSGTGSDSGEVVVAGGCLPAAREGYDVYVFEDGPAVVGGGQQ